MLLYTSLLLLLPSTLALPSIIPSTIHEKRTQPIKNAINRRRVEPDTFLPMRIGLAHNSKALQEAESWLMDVADPDSANFGKHWSQQNVIDAFKPSDESVKAVTDWLADHGIDKFIHTDNQGWFALDLPASKAEELLQTEFYEHQTEEGRFKVSSDEYSLPQSVRNHVDFVMPGVKERDITGRSPRSKAFLRAAKEKRSSFDQLNERKAKASSSSSAALSSSAAPSSSSASAPPSASASNVPPYPANSLEHCAYSASPACIRALYNFTAPDPNAKVSKNNSMGLYETILQLSRQGDLNKFWTSYTDIPSGVAPIHDSIDGAIVTPNQTIGWRKTFLQGTTWGDDLGESTLDLQMAFPIVYPQTVTVFEVGDYYNEINDNAGYNDFLDGIDGSYCTYKADGEKGNDPSVDPVYPDTRPHGFKGKMQCGVFKPTNVISMSYSTGEEELPAAYEKRECKEFLKLALQGVSVFAASGDYGVGPCEDGVFNVNFPASCPWITSVGATHIFKDNNVTQPERAVPFWSGGGFSNTFKRPSYQDDAVNTYFKTANLSIPYYNNGGDADKGKGSYNRNGRGYPDVSALGSSIADVIEGEYGTIGGTSAATPLVASLFNRIIEERIAAGKGPLGLINPTLYKNGDAWNDITIGNNHDSCKYGFSCAKGWDPLTGFGTPNYPKMLDVFLNLP